MIGGCNWWWWWSNEPTNLARCKRRRTCTNECTGDRKREEEGGLIIGKDEY
jgi:hypothetical protein